MALKRYARDVLWVAGGNYVALLAGIPIGLMTPLFLAPAAYGIIAVVDSLMEIVRHYPLGSLAAMAREVPLLRDRGETGRADEMRNAVWTGNILLGLLAFGIPVGIAAFTGQSREFILCLALACTAVVAWRVGEVHSVLLRCQRRFREESRIVVLAALVPLVLLPVCLWKWGVAGYFVSSAVVPAMCFVLYRAASGERPRFRIAAWTLVPILSFGIPAAGLDLADSASVAIDRMILGKWWSLEALGLYFFAYKFSRYVLSLPQSVGAVTQRHLLGRLALAADERDVADAVTVPAAYVGWAMALVVGAAAILLPELIRLAYPRFASALPALRIFLLAAWWPSIGVVFWKHLVATKRLKSALFAYVPAFAVVVGGFFVLRDRLDLRLAALVSAAGLTVRSLIAVCISLAALSHRPLDVPARFVALLPPFLLLLGALVAYDLWWPARRIPGGPLCSAVLAAVAFALLLAPFFVRLMKRHPILEQVEESKPA